jgi:acyl-CoA hydrolase
MVIGAEVISENPFNGNTRTTTTAFLTFVSVDEFGKPTPVPKLKVETKEAQKLYEQAQKRKEINKKL